MISNKIISAKVLTNFKIFVTFSNGKKGVFDMTPYLKYEAFLHLTKVENFKQVMVKYGTLTWNDEIDIAPDTVESELLPVK
jgi:hypothetical protein